MYFAIQFQTEIAIQKYNHQDLKKTLSTVKTEEITTDQTIRTKSHSLLAPVIIAKPNFSLFPLLRHLTLWFKSIFFFSNQFKFSVQKHFFKFGFTPYKAEQPLQDMELQEKGAKKS